MGHEVAVKRWTSLVLSVVGGLGAWLGTRGDAVAGATLFQEDVGVFGAQPCGGSGCYTRYLRLADLDGDLDLEVIFANGGGQTQPVVVYENDGAGGFTDVSATALGGYLGHTWQVAVGDIDGDDDLDIFAPDADGSVGALFINDGSGVFEDEADARLPATTIATESTRLGDLDGDGDLDLVVAGSGAAVYLNDGTGVFAELADAVPDGAGSDVNDIDLFDVDRDFDLDLLTNDHGGADRIWTNDGTGQFTATAFTSSGGLHYGPGICDIDGDTDLDIWIDNQGPDYTERLWANDGSGAFTDVTVAQVSGNPGADDNGIICADTDSDGDLDAVVVALGTAERLLVNDGTGNFTYLSGAFSGPVDSSLWAEMGDVNGDHRIDIVTGQGESGSFLNRVFLATNAVPVDDTPPRIIVAEDPPGEVAAGETAPLRFAVSDDALSDNGPRLSAAYALVDPRGVALQVPAAFVGGDLFRVLLPSDGLSGDVTVRLCAVDLNDNTGCSADFVYPVAGGGTEGGSSSGSGDATGADTSDGGSASTDPTDATDPTATSEGSASATASATDATATASATGGGDSSGTDGGQNDDGGGSSGCGCASDRSASPWWALALVGVRRRRR